MLTIKKMKNFQLLHFYILKKFQLFHFCLTTSLHKKDCFFLDSVRGKKEQKPKEKCVQFSNTRKFGLTKYNKIL